MNLVIEQDANLYIANGTVASVEVINMGMTSPVAYGNSYVFNGVQINGNGKGKDGSIGIYYDAPRLAGVDHGVGALYLRQRIRQTRHAVSAQPLHAEPLSDSLYFTANSGCMGVGRQRYQ